MMSAPLSPPSDAAPATAWQPRERLLLFGRATLSEAELLAIVLGGGHALPLAAALLHRFGGLAGLNKASPHELLEVRGVGAARAAAVCAALEMAAKIAADELPLAAPLRSPQDVAAFAVARWGDAEQEVFVVLGVDARQRLVLVRETAMGSLSEVEVHPREVFRPLIRGGAHAAILLHNHPSGEAEPSDADLRLTERLVEAGHLMGIPVLDHLIVTRRGTTSLAMRGLFEL